MQEETPDSVTDEAISVADRNAAEEWKVVAKKAIKWLCDTREEFIADDIHIAMGKYYPDVKTHNTSALGSLMRMASKNNWCEKSGRYAQSQRISTHKKNLPVWKSLLYLKARV